MLGAVGDRDVRGLSAFRGGDAGAWLTLFNERSTAPRAGEGLADADAALLGERRAFRLLKGPEESIGRPPRRLLRTAGA